MPHKRIPKEHRNKQAKRLLSKEKVEKVPSNVYGDDRKNLVPNMSFDAIDEVKSIICDRYSAVKDTTDGIAAKMDNWEKQYQGEWQDELLQADPTNIFLPKSREQVQSVHAHIMLLISQINPMITAAPQTFSSIDASQEEHQRAKLAEAMLDYYLNDVLKFRDDIFPRWLKTFLKFSLGVFKITYEEDDFLPDINVEVVDRGLLYIDPTAQDLKKARWVIEKQFITRSEVVERVEQGYWYLPDNRLHELSSGMQVVADNDVIIKRIFGDDMVSRFSTQADELVEVYNYWQAPTGGLDDAYGVIIGGIDGDLVRYGGNPFPVKRVPYVGKAFDPHEYQIDGLGMLEQYEPIQDVVNNFLMMRIKDVRSNVITPAIIPEDFVNAQTQDDFEQGRKFVRLSKEAIESARAANPNFDLRREIFELPVHTSTQELFTDLQWILGQGKETSHVSDVFKGQAPPRQATLGQVQEQLTRNQGVFRPIFMQVMRAIEEVGEFMMEYFRDPIFYPEERIIQVIGKNKYSDTVAGWHNVPGTNTSIRNVSADEIDIDTTLNAVNGADAIMSKTFLMNSLQQIFASIGQIPELFTELKEKIDFAKIVDMMINASGNDTDAVRLDPQEAQIKAQQEVQKQQQAIQQQEEQALRQLEMQSNFKQMEAEIEILKAEKLASLKLDADLARDENKVDLEIEKAQDQSDNIVDQIVTKVGEQLRADMLLMQEEARLERESIGISVGHNEDVQEPEPKEKKGSKKKENKPA